MKRSLSLVALVTCLGGCTATTSFAPPDVDISQVDKGRHAASDCVQSSTGTAISHDVAGASELIDNFVDAYRCARSSAADGRQGFEVPSFLALVGTATAMAFGAGKNVAIAGGAANSVLTGAKAYYVPQEKANIFDHALDAVLCIKTESVGVDPYNISKTGQTQRLRRESGRDGGTSVTISADEQYFIMIEAALLSVERILGQQLSKAGRFDPEGIAAQITQLADKERNAKADLAGTEGVRARAGTDDYATLQLALLKVKLDQCVVRAKMS